MIGFDEQLELFKLIGMMLKEKIECLVIGGSAMLFYNAKDSTKDIDLVFMDKKERDELKEVLYKIGFNPKPQIKIFEHYETAKDKPIIMERKDTRFDLFVKEVICFKISDNILNRIKEVHEFNNLIIKLVAPEDIILLKCATEREKDRIDAAELIKKFNINWNIIINESLHQTKIGKNIFPVFLYDFLTELKENLRLEIPKDVLIRLRKISEDEMIKVMKKRK